MLGSTLAGLMTLFKTILAAMALLVAAQPAQIGAQSPVRRLTLSEQRVVRIPLRSTAVPLPKAGAEDKETRGPKCVARSKIAGASLNGLKSIDFTLRSGTRLRARLKSSCPAIDYYAGFYLNPTVDGDICSDRDAVHARSGGECQIDIFRKLTAKGAKPKR